MRESELILPSGIRFWSAWKRLSASMELGPHSPLGSSLK